jgi:hypothetical protein
LNSHRPSSDDITAVIDTECREIIASIMKRVKYLRNNSAHPDAIFELHKLAAQIQERIDA